MVSHQAICTSARNNWRYLKSKPDCLVFLIHMPLLHTCACPENAVGPPQPDQAHLPHNCLLRTSKSIGSTSSTARFHVSITPHQAATRLQWRLKLQCSVDSPFPLSVLCSGWIPRPSNCFCSALFSSGTSLSYISLYNISGHDGKQRTCSSTTTRVLSSTVCSSWQAAWSVSCCACARKRNLSKVLPR